MYKLSVWLVRRERGQWSCVCVVGKGREGIEGGHVVCRYMLDKLLD